MKVCTDACLFGAWVAQLNKQQCQAVLDVGTGTGLLSLMLAQANTAANITGLELDENASQQSIANINASPFVQQITIKNTDAKLFVSTNKFDVIISNPPFYENDLASSSYAKNLAKHNNGLLLTDLLTVIQNNITPNGEAYILLPFSRKQEAEGLLKQNNFSILNCASVYQTTKHLQPFRIMLQLKEGLHKNTTQENICIKKDDEKYTNRFIELLQPYYLHL
jgi:tRNA1Val (adenine37-N6)-methyltransferase